MQRTLDNPYYYLDNFHTVLDWIEQRYGDLLDGEESAFIVRFRALPQASRALFVRMVMRKGELFRRSKLNYAEIGDTASAAAPLLREGWVDDAPWLDVDCLFALLKKDELAEIFALPAASKAEQRATLREQLGDEAKPLAEWHAELDDVVYHLAVAPLCDRLRLMFFGNLYQDWTEFVLADLGIYQYEKVEFSEAARGFRERADIDTYLHLQQCRQRFQEGEEIAAVLADLPDALANPWLEGRRAKLFFQLAQQLEKEKDWPAALAIYRACAYPGARARCIRVLELCERHDEALALAEQAVQAPESEAESQQLARMLPRLRRRLGQAKPRTAKPVPPEEWQLVLPRPQDEQRVELAVREHLRQQGGQVHYVENALINSLFGLLCWQTVFMPLPGAFFHPFHAGPADLHAPDFYQRRAAGFDACLAQLDTGDYVATIRRNFAAKTGLQSPFVYWDALSEELLEQALMCIPAAHLKACFTRLLQDIKANRSGLPDLVRFWPEHRRYQLVEVKGPGDRLQDNQIRWLDYCAAHQVPVAVCYVQWAEGGA